MYDSELGPDPAAYAGLMAPVAVRLERLNDTLHHVSHIVERFNDGRSRQRQSFVDRTTQLAISELANGGEKRFVGSIGKAGKINRDCSDCAEISLIGETAAAASEGFRADLSHGDSAGHSALTNADDGNMLISNVEIVHGAKNLVTANVRLEGTHDVLDVGRRRSHLGFQLSLKPGDIFPEWEIDLFGLGSAESYEVVCEDIKGGAEIVNGVAEDGGKRTGNAPAAFECYPICAVPRIELQEHCVRVILQIRGNFRLKFGDVLPPPRNL